MSTTDHDPNESPATEASTGSAAVASGPDGWVVHSRAAARYARSTPAGRVLVRQSRSLGRRVKRWMVLLAVAQVVAFMGGYGTKPGGPFGPEPISCGTATTVASVKGQSIPVTMARTQGEALRRLAGPPPDPETTHEIATKAADTVVVTVLALKASARGEAEPAKATARNTAVAQSHAEQVAQTAAACTPCPETASGVQPATALQPGSVFQPAGGVVAPVACAAQPSGVTAPLGPVPAGGGAAGGWGGHANGRIPAAAMCRPAFDPDVQARCDAANALDQLNTAYRAEFGADLPVTDSYRDYDAQVAVKAAKPHLAAKPGTSNHGWGLAIDFGPGIATFGTLQHQWMTANAPAHGWVHPAWARQDGSKPEPWHWEYTGAPTATAPAQAAGTNA